MRWLFPVLALAGCLAPAPVFYDDYEEVQEGWFVVGLTVEEGTARVGAPPAFEVRPGALRLVVERNGTEDGAGFVLAGPDGVERAASSRAEVAAPVAGAWSVEPRWRVVDAASFTVRILY